MNYPIRVFEYRLYWKEWLLLLATYLITEGIFSWLLVPNSVIYNNYEKILSLFIYVFILWHFQQLTRQEKILAGVFTALMIKLVIESLAIYGTVFQQFTIFTVIFPVIYTIFIKYVLRRLDIDLLGFIAKFYLVTYVVFMLLYGRGFSFSLAQVDMEDYGPFSGDSRIIHARSILMIIIPYLWYLNKFLHARRIKFLLPLLFCVGILLLHQHRSVWSTAIVATFLYLVFAVRDNKKNVKPLLQLILFSIGGIVLAYIVISSLFPSAIDFFAQRFSEILDPAKDDSTGNFRIEQSMVYGDYIMQRPILGWSFDGFYLPNPLVDWWDENTGHHFHEGFIEILFYHGLLGLLLKYSYILIILKKAFTARISAEAAILSAFCISGLIFSLNYVLPLIFWGHTGMCLFYLEAGAANKKTQNISI